MARNRELEKEILRIKQLGEKMTEKEIKKLAKEYKKTLSEVRAIALSIYTKYSSEDDELEMTSVDIFNEMKRIDEVLIREARRIGVLEVALATALLKSVYQDTYYRTAFALDRGVEIGIKFNLLRPEFVEAAISTKIEGYLYSDRIWANKSKMMTRLRSHLKEAMEKGTSIEKLSRRLSKDLGADYYNSYRLIRNESARVQSIAQEQIYQDSDVVEELLFDATLDEVTTDICQSLHGTIYKKSEPHPAIPDDTHIQCRSCYVPVVSGWSPTKKRDNMTGEVIDYPSNFEDWKKSKGID